MAGYTSEIRAELEHIEYNHIIVASEMHEAHLAGVPVAIYYKVLERMVNEGTLAHLTKGLYYRPKVTRFGRVPISEDEIAGFYITDRQGIMVGYRLYNRVGITTQVGKQIEILSKALKESRKHIQNVSVRRVSIELNEQTIPTIETLEILQNYQKIEDASNQMLYAYMEDFAKKYSDQAAHYVLEHINYKKATIAFLEQFLNYMQVENTLGQYLSPLSNYAIPGMEGFV